MRKISKKICFHFHAPSSNWKSNLPFFVCSQWGHFDPPPFPMMHGEYSMHVAYRCDQPIFQMADPFGLHSLFSTDAWFWLAEILRNLGNPYSFGQWSAHAPAYVSRSLIKRLLCCTPMRLETFGGCYENSVEAPKRIQKVLTKICSANGDQWSAHTQTTIVKHVSPSLSTCADVENLRTFVKFCRL